jgi:hypothetical protein
LQGEGGGVRAVRKGRKSKASGFGSTSESQEIMVGPWGISMVVRVSSETQF